MLKRKTLFFITFLVLNSLATWAMDNENQDEIDFFNVGQGHAVLINKYGYYNPSTKEPFAPLLIDAGSSSLPDTPQEQYLWEEKQRDHFVSKIASRILKFWKAANKGSLRGGNYKLNVIVTHGDDDHGNFVPLILKQLVEEQVKYSFSFTPVLLLGGAERHYLKKDGRKKIGSFLDLLKEAKPGGGYFVSEKWPGMHLEGKAFPLETSGCITHLFCPQGTGQDGDENTWSIITRVQINGISAIITGDADSRLKSKMLVSLSGQEDGLKSDILMLPHHGAEGTFEKNWDEKVNPQAIVVGSAPHGGRLEKPDKGYRHPRGETILESLRLLNNAGRIWNKVGPHAIEYYGAESLHQQIEKLFEFHKKYLFERVPNSALIELEQQPQLRWHLVWTDAPIYTLWTTGSLFFSQNVQKPQFIDAPNGLTAYIALTDPRYYLSPEQRPENKTLTTLVGYFLQDGIGDPEQLEKTIRSFPPEHIQGTERKGVILTQNLMLNSNREKILKALWEIPLEQRDEIFTQFKNLTTQTRKDYSTLYRVLISLTQMRDRSNYLNYLNEIDILLPKDALRTAEILEILCLLTLEEAQEIIRRLRPAIEIYPSFQDMPLGVYRSFLETLKALALAPKDNRVFLFNVVKPVLMFYETHDNPNKKFYNASDNANLIKIYSDIDAQRLPLFVQNFEKTLEYLTPNHETGCYFSENKFFFVKTLMALPVQDRSNFLESLLPIVQPISKTRCESHEIEKIIEELSQIYNQENYGFRHEYFIKIYNTGTVPESLKDFKWYLQASATYAKTKINKD